MIQVAAREEKQLLEVLRCQEPAPDAVLGVGDVGQQLGGHPCLDVVELITRAAEAQVLEEQGEPIIWLGEPEPAHRGAFAVDLDISWLVVDVAGADPDGRPLEFGQGLGREDESERGVSIGVRPVLPPNRLAEEQGDLAARAEDALPGDPLDGLLVTDQPGRRRRVGGEDEVVEGADPVRSIVAVVDGAPFRINPFDPGSSLNSIPISRSIAASSSVSRQSPGLTNP